MTGVAKHFILARDERGSVAIMFTLLLVPMMAAIGIAVDGARWYSARQVTSGAIEFRRARRRPPAASGSR